MTRALCIVATAVAFAGCASTVYEQPPAGPTATIRYRLTSPVGQSSVFVYQDNQCSQRKFVGELQSAPLPFEKLAGKVIDPNLAEKRVTVAANKPFTSRVLLDPVGNGNVTCTAGFALVPKPAMTYDVEARVQNDKCEVLLWQVDAVDMSKRAPVVSDAMKCS